MIIGHASLEVLFIRTISFWRGRPILMLLLHLQRIQYLSKYRLISIPNEAVSYYVHLRACSHYHYGLVAKVFKIVYTRHIYGVIVFEYNSP